MPCLYDDLKDTTVWVGTNAQSATSKTVACPYCTSCRTIKTHQGSPVGEVSPNFSELKTDLTFTNRGKVT